MSTTTDTIIDNPSNPLSEDEKGRRADYIEDYGNLGLTVLMRFGSSSHTKNLDEALSVMENNYEGCHEDEKAFGEYWFDEVSGGLENLGDDLKKFFNYEAWFQQESNKGAFHTIRNENGLHVFANN